MLLSLLLYASVFILSLAVTFLLFTFPLKSLLDRSGDRSLHRGVVPRSGGIAIVLSLATGGVLLWQDVHALVSPCLLVALVVLSLVSLWDDFASLSPLWRVAAQGIVAILLVFGDQLFFSADMLLPSLAWRWITVFGMVWMINLYNFMDGMDGFAAGMAIIGFGAFTLAGYLQHDRAYATGNLLVVLAVAGFWCWNFPPARIFMGDLGSTVLGLLASVSALQGVQRGVFPLWVPVLVFVPFWVDATWTLFRRLLAREPVWQAHRQHIYQRLVLSGHSHRAIVLGEYLVMLACAGMALLPLWSGVGYNDTYLPLSTAVLCVTGLVFLETWLTKKLQRSNWKTGS